MQLNSLLAAAAAALGFRQRRLASPPILALPAIVEQRVASPARAARRRLVARHGRRQALKLIKAARREYAAVDAGLPT